MPSRPPIFSLRPVANSTEQRRDYDHRRGSARERGYTAEWDVASDAHRRVHPLCVGCEAVGVIRLATITDHVIPHKGDMDLFWDRSLWQSSCEWHHSVVKQRLEQMYTRAQISAAALWLNSSSAITLTRELTA